MSVDFLYLIGFPSIFFCTAYSKFPDFANPRNTSTPLLLTRCTSDEIHARILKLLYFCKNGISSLLYFPGQLSQTLNAYIFQIPLHC